MLPAPDTEAAPNSRGYDSPAGSSRIKLYRSPGIWKGLTCGIPVVVLTSSSEERHVVQTYEVGANSYIINPVDFEQFTESVRDIGRYWLVINHARAARLTQIRRQNPDNTILPVQHSDRMGPPISAFGPLRHTETAHGLPLAAQEPTCGRRDWDDRIGPIYAKFVAI
jgi:hypothetical protein